MTRKEEIQAVKELGEKIGYGNMMDLASALWATSLKVKYSIEGEFLPVISFNVKSNAINGYKAKQQRRIEEIESELRG